MLHAFPLLCASSGFSSLSLISSLCFCWVSDQILIGLTVTKEFVERHQLWSITHTFSFLFMKPIVSSSCFYLADDPRVHYLSLLFTDMNSIFLIVSIVEIILNSNPALQPICIYFQHQVIVQ